MAKIKRESWLIFYRTKSGKLTSFEAPIFNYPDGSELSKSEVLDEELARITIRSFKDFERDSKGEPIVKRMQYV